MQKCCCLVVCRVAGFVFVRRRAGGLAAATLKIEAENPELIDVERPVGSCDLRPPLLARIIRQTNSTSAGDATKRANARCGGWPYEAPRKSNVGKLAAMVK